MWSTNVSYFMVVNHIQKKDGTSKAFSRSGHPHPSTGLYSCLMQIPIAMRVSAPFEGEHGEANSFGGYLVFMLFYPLGPNINIRDRG